MQQVNEIMNVNVIKLTDVCQFVVVVVAAVVAIAIVVVNHELSAIFIWLNFEERSCKSARAVLSLTLFKIARISTLLSQRKQFN